MQRGVQRIEGIIVDVTMRCPDHFVKIEMRQELTFERQAIDAGIKIEIPALASRKSITWLFLSQVIVVLDYRTVQSIESM